MAGGSQIIISSDGITIITPRVFKVHAGQHIFKGGEKVEVKLPKFNPYFSGYFVVRDKQTQQPLANYAYELMRQDGQKIIGKTNNKGETLLVNTTTAQEVKFIEPNQKKKRTHQLFVAGSDPINLRLEYFDEE